MNFFRYNGKNIEWEWTHDKQHHVTYIPKKRELKIIDPQGFDMQEVKNALWECLQIDFDEIRSRQNRLARERRRRVH